MIAKRTAPMSSGTTIATSGSGVGRAALGQVGDLEAPAPHRAAPPAATGRTTTTPASPDSTPLPGRVSDAVALQVHLELGVAEPDEVAALEVGPGDLLPSSGDAVGRAEVDDLDHLGDDELGVPARDRLVVQLHLAAASSADVCRAAGERELLARVGARADHRHRSGSATVDEALARPG